MAGAKRNDKRGAAQLRPVKLELRPLAFAEASCLVRWGKTHVVCAATVEESVPPFLRGKGQGWVTAEYGMLPRCGGERIPRESARGKVSGRTSEIQRLIGRSLRCIVDREALGERTILIDCDVIQADGGTRCAGITGGYVALALAVRKLQRAGLLARNPLKDSVCAVSAGVVGGRAVLDLDYSEDSSADVDMNIVMTGKGRFVEVQGTAEGAAYGRETLDELLRLGAAGARALTRLQKAALGGGAGTGRSAK